MPKSIASFCRDEDGAVTVDWVVLTAAVVGLAIAAWTTIEDASVGLTDAAGVAVTGQDDGFGS